MNTTEEEPIPKTGNDILRDKDHCIACYNTGFQACRESAQAEMIEKLKKAGIDLTNLQ